MSMPIISNDLRSSCRALLLQSHMGDSGGETEVGWKYPDEWLPLPDAGEGECILLIRPSESRKKFAVGLICYNYSDLQNFPDYKVIIDWGDGNIETLDNKRLSGSRSAYYEHEYADEFVGKYLLVKIQTMYAYIENGDGTTNRIAVGVLGHRNGSGDISSILAASTGTSLELYESTSSFNAMYVRFCMNDFNKLSVDGTYNDWNTKPYSGYYRYAFGVFTGDLTKRIDFTGSPEVFGCTYNPSLQGIKEITGIDSVTDINKAASSIFGSSRALEKISFPEVTELGVNMWNYMYGVREIYLPKCTKIGAESIRYNYCLQKLTVAKGCEIDPTALQNNYQYVEIVEV